MSETNPGVIYVQMSGMGATGPWSDFVTYAPTIHGLGGLTYLTGVPGRGDIGIGYSYNDHQAGLHGAVAVLAALEGRANTGRGQRVDLSQFEVGVNFAGLALLDWFGNGRSASPVANRDAYDNNAPHGCYPLRRCPPAMRSPTNAGLRSPACRMTNGAASAMCWATRNGRGTPRSPPSRAVPRRPTC